MNTKQQLEYSQKRIEILNNTIDNYTRAINTQEENYRKLDKDYHEALAEVNATKQTLRDREVRIERLETALRHVSNAVNCLT